MANNEIFSPDISDMLKIAIKHNGCISNIAREMNVNRDTIYEYLKRNPEGKKIIDKVRGYNTEIELDTAEEVIRYNLSNYKKNAGLAQRAAEKVIDKKGHLRSWGVEQTEKVSANQTDLDKDDMIFKLIAENAILKQKANQNASE